MAYVSHTADEYDCSNNGGTLDDPDGVYKALASIGNSKDSCCDAALDDSRTRCVEELGNEEELLINGELLFEFSMERRCKDKP